MESIWNPYDMESILWISQCYDCRMTNLSTLHVCMPVALGSKKGLLRKCSSNTFSQVWKPKDPLKAKTFKQFPSLRLHTWISLNVNQELSTQGWHQHKILNSKEEENVSTRNRCTGWFFWLVPPRKVLSIELVSPNSNDSNWSLLLLEV